MRISFINVTIKQMASQLMCVCLCECSFVIYSAIVIIVSNLCVVGDKNQKEM